MTMQPTECPDNLEKPNVASPIEPVVMLPMDYAVALDEFLCEINLKSTEFGNKAMSASISLNKLIEDAKAT